MIRLSKSCLGPQEKKAVNRVISNAYLGMGPEVKNFEKEIKEYLNTKSSIIAVSSGTAALHISLQACGIGINDEVLVPSITYIASFQAISATGASPIACDIDLDTGFIDLKDAKKRVSKRTKAIMPVHYASNSSQMNMVYKFAKDFNLKVIEDAAHSFGSFREGKKIGVKGDIICFSFDGIKNITCGEGGAIVAKDQKIISNLLDIRLLGVAGDSNKRYSKQRSWNFDVYDQGWRYHLSDLMAAIGREQLKKIEKFHHKRKEIIDIYIKNLKNIREIKILNLDYDNNHQHIFPIRVLNKKRNKLKEYLENKGIQTGIHYQPNHLLKKYRTRYNLPKSKIFGEEILSLPLHCDLRKKDVSKIIQDVKSFF